MKAQWMQFEVRPCWRGVAAVVCLAGLWLGGSSAPAAAAHSNDGAAHAAGLAEPLPCAGDCDASDRVTAADIVALVRALAADDVPGACLGRVAPGNAETAAGVLRQAFTHIFDSRCSQPTEALFADGLRQLGAGNLAAAAVRLEQVRAGDPNDPRVRLYADFTRAMVSLVDDIEVRILLLDLGIGVTGTSRDICRYDAFDFGLPRNTPTAGSIAARVRQKLGVPIAVLIASASAAADGPPFAFDLQSLPWCLRPRSAMSAGEVEIDRADLLALVAGLRVLRAVVSLAEAYDLEVSVSELAEEALGPVFDRHPNLLVSRAAERLGDAREDIDQALLAVEEAIDSILEETDPQQDDLLVISPGDLADVEAVRDHLARARLGLREEITLPEVREVEGGLRLHLSPLLSGEIASLRPLLPPVGDDGRFDISPMPDPTFAGTLPGLTQLEFEMLVYSIEREIKRFRRGW